MSKRTANPIAIAAWSNRTDAPTKSGLGPASSWKARSEAITAKKPIPMFAAVKTEGIK
jgi:hypothetical protein